jgi:hypothetical protein
VVSTPLVAAVGAGVRTFNYSQGTVMLQIVFVKWGTRYGADMINRPVRAILKHASCDVRFVCVTDDDQANFDPEVVTKPFPTFTAPLSHLKGGCRLKLSMFAPGILQEGVPALFLDLDTLVRGDVARVRDHITNYGGIHLMRSHYLQWWKVQKWVGPAIGNKYYHGNSSAVGFMPENYYWLFDQFNKTVVGDPNENLSKTLGVDDRFISCYCRETLRVFPTSLMVKFSGEYMSPFHAAESFRSRLPWVRARRQGQVAVTFAGNDLKPDKLVSLGQGDEIRYKWLKTRWNYEEFQEYWAARIA